jgi:peptide deformylase
MIYKLLEAGSPSLSVKLPETSAEEIKEKHNLTLRELHDNLAGTMAATGGIGLSANQCGILVRAFVMYTNIDKKEVTLFLNPKITWESEETNVFSEGCLTYPFLFLNITRPKSIKFTYTDQDGNTQEGAFTGLTARIFQHEYDHMEGKNFTQLASKLKLEMGMKKARKKLKKLKKVA